MDNSKIAHVFREPQSWPKAKLLPAALTKLSYLEIEERMGLHLSHFQDEGEPCAGIALQLDTGLIFAIFQRLRTEVSVSLYLPVTQQSDDSVRLVMSVLNIKDDEMDFRSRR